MHNQIHAALAGRPITRGRLNWIHFAPTFQYVPIPNLHITQNEIMCKCLCGLSPTALSGIMWAWQHATVKTSGRGRPSRVDSDLTTAPMIRAAIVAHLDVGGRALSEQQSAIQQFLDAVLQTDSARQGNYVEDRGLEGGQFEKDVQAIRELLALNTYTDASDAAETYGITTEELY